MRIARAMAITVLVLPVVAAAAGVGLRLFMERGAESALYPGDDVAITALRGALPPNAYLACPPGYCAVAGAAPSPTFAVGADRLYTAFGRLIAAEPRVVTVLAEPEQRRIIVIQRSAVFGFPDLVTAEIVALAADRSSLALYSRARYGRSDFGVNRRRVEQWLARLPALANQ